MALNPTLKLHAALIVPFLNGLKCWNLQLNWPSYIPLGIAFHSIWKHFELALFRSVLHTGRHIGYVCSDDRFSQAWKRSSHIKYILASHLLKGNHTKWNEHEEISIHTKICKSLPEGQKANQDLLWGHTIPWEYYFCWIFLFKQNKKVAITSNISPKTKCKILKSMRVTFDFKS